MQGPRQGRVLDDGDRGSCAPRPGYAGPSRPCPWRSRRARASPLSGNGSRQRSVSGSSPRRRLRRPRPSSGMPAQRRIRWRILPLVCGSPSASLCLVLDLLLAHRQLLVSWCFWTAKSASENRKPRNATIRKDAEHRVCRPARSRRRGRCWCRRPAWLTIFANGLVGDGADDRQLDQRLQQLPAAVRREQPLEAGHRVELAELRLQRLGAGEEADLGDRAEDRAAARAIPPTMQPISSDDPEAMAEQSDALARRSGCGEDGLGLRRQRRPAGRRRCAAAAAAAMTMTSRISQLVRSGDLAT